MKKNILKLVSPHPPSVNHYLAHRVIRKNNKMMVLTYKSEKAKSYQEKFARYVAQEAKKQNWIKSENKFQHYYVDCTFYFSRIDDDANNYFKCMLDAITDSNSVWIDDNQVCERVLGVFYDTKNPRVEITIYPVEYVGIFKNKKCLSAFEDKCVTCSRYGRNCSILKRAKCGYCVNEIDDKYNCNKFKEKIKKLKK